MQDALRLTVSDEIERLHFTIDQCKQQVNRLEDDLIKHLKEFDELGDYCERLRMELSRHGWGDMHYSNSSAQDPAIVALLNERGTNGSTRT